ncbi:DUF4349 domain-containing protein [Flavobacterium zepuense]|uniref:DUF4349 domain-containing protein n=1 Tax=Flavobacterium zepuense TaxID=2593302 RepID=A0A552UVD9_9FLAO|nr:DUF4349 domain-containing protein [Flavobacterium zepuense]TRW22201.1 DUF4349 domain-containing protein [Flavobacterium zepuense]
MKNTLYPLLLLLALTACKKEGENTPSSIASSEVVATSESADAAAPTANLPEAKAETAPVASTQMLIKTANLRFETADLNTTARKVQDATAKYSAVVQTDTQGNEGSSLLRSITVRIPSQNFDKFIADISKGVDYFERREITSEDVSEEYVDIESRLKAKRVLEERYFELLKRANKISEILEIEKELAIIREQIEGQQGRLNFIRNRVLLSTINIEFYKTAAAQETATVSYGSKIWVAVKSGFNGLSSFLLGLLYIWPIILIFVIGYFIYKKNTRKKDNHA